MKFKITDNDLYNVDCSIAEYAFSIISAYKKRVNERETHFYVDNKYLPKNMHSEKCMMKRMNYVLDELIWVFGEYIPVKQFYPSEDEEKRAKVAMKLFVVFLPSMWL